MTAPRPLHRIALLEPSVAAECVVTEMMGQIRCGAPFLAGALVGRGYEARVFAEELQEFDGPLMDRLAREFDAVGLSLALNTLPRGLQVARALKARRPDLPIVVGGPSASAFADRLLTASDAVLKGRGENSLPQVLDWWAGKRGPEGIPGLAWNGPHGLERSTAHAPPTDGPVRYDLVEGLGPVTVRPGLFGGPKPAVYSLFASTGCVRQCRFCKSEKVHLARSHDAVIEDLEMLLRLHGDGGPARFMLVDDCLFADLAWTKELLRRIASATRGRAVSFSAQFHVHPTRDDELMRLFAEAHFTSLAIGFESVSQASLDGERKGTTPADNDMAIEQCRRFGIVPYGYFVVGFDTDDEADVGAVFEYILRRKLVAQVLPVGIMNRDEDGRPTPEAPRVLSDTSFGATVFVSHRPARLSAAHLQTLINRGYRHLTAWRRLRDFTTAYERFFLAGFRRCFEVWEPAMQRHVEVLKELG